MSTLLLATRNPHKLKELRRALRGLPMQVVTLADFPHLASVCEDGATFEVNAIKKAVVPSRRVSELVLAEDSGLVVAALRGAPGVRSARFSRARPGVDRDAANNAKLLRLLRSVPPSRRQAAFVCVIAVASRGHVLGVVRGECRGAITMTPRGRTGFGYDPLFIPRGRRRTFAELGPRVKDRLSHRARALTKARPLIARAHRTHRAAARTPVPSRSG